ncbi:MAG: hypothetical protein LBI81_03275, partial [Puniceicoccales bacterium]|nr:hypothetical protein [Puniceicoccales bacterium]
MSSLTLDRDAKIKEFAEDCGYEVGINCNESARNAAFELYEFRVNGGSSIINFLKIIYKYLDGESKRMPLTPLSQRGLEKFIDC